MYTLVPTRFEVSVQDIRLKRLMILGRRNIEVDYYDEQGIRRTKQRGETDTEYSDRVTHILEQAHTYNEINVESWKMENDKCYVVYSVPRRVAANYTGSSSTFPYRMTPTYNNLRYV